MARRGGRRGKGRRGRGSRGGRGAGRGGRGAAAAASAVAPDANNSTAGIPPPSSVGYLHKKFKRLAEVGNEDDSGTAGTAAGEQSKAGSGASGENSDPTFGPTFNGSGCALTGPGGPLRLRRQSSGVGVRADALARGETPVVKHCDRCGLRFKTKASLQKHRLMTHHIKDDGVEIPAFLRRPPVTTTSSTTVTSSSTTLSTPSTSSEMASTSSSSTPPTVPPVTEAGVERKIYKPKFRMKCMEEFEETVEEPARPAPASSNESSSASSVSLLMPVPAASAEPPPAAPSPFLASAALINPMMSVLSQKDDADMASAMELSAAVATAIATVDADVDVPFDLSARPSNGGRNSFSYPPSGGLQDQNARLQQDGDKNDGPFSLVTQNHYGKPLSLQQPSTTVGRPPSPLSSPQHSPLNLRQVQARDQPPPPPSHSQPPFHYPGDPSLGSRRHLQQHNYQDHGAAHQSLPPHGMPVPMTHQLRPSYQPQAQSPHDLSQSTSLQRHSAAQGAAPSPTPPYAGGHVRSGLPRPLENDRGAPSRQPGSISTGTPRQRYQPPPSAPPAVSAAGPPPQAGTKRPMSTPVVSAPSPTPAQQPLMVQHMPYGMPLMPPGYPRMPVIVPYPHLSHGPPPYLMPKSYLQQPGPVPTPPPTSAARSTPPASSMTVTATAQWKPSLRIDIPKSSASNSMATSSSSSSSSSLNSPSAAAVAAAAKGLRSPEAITQHITKIISRNEAIVETLNPLWSSKRYMRQEAAAKAAAAAAAVSSSSGSNHSTTISGSGVMMASSTSIASVPPAPTVAQPIQSPGGKFSVSKILSFDKGGAGSASAVRSSKIIAPPSASSNSTGTAHHHHHPPPHTMAPMPSSLMTNSIDNGVHGKKTCGKCNAIFYNADSHLVHTRTCVGPLTFGFGAPVAAHVSAAAPSPSPQMASIAKKSPGNVNGGGGSGGLATTSRIPEVQSLQATDLSKKPLQPPVQPPPPPQNLAHRAYLPPQQSTSATFQHQSPQPQVSQQASPSGGVRPSGNKAMSSSAVNSNNVPPAKKRKVDGTETSTSQVSQPAMITPVPVAPMVPMTSHGSGMHMFGSQVRINDGAESKTVVHIGTKLASSTPVPVTGTSTTSMSSGQSSPVVVTIAKSGLHSGGTTIIQQPAKTSSPSIPSTVFDQSKAPQSLLGGLSPAGTSPAAAVVAAGAIGPGVEGALYRLEPNVNAKFPYFLGPQLLKLPSGPSVFDSAAMFSSGLKNEKSGKSDGNGVRNVKPGETQPPPPLPVTSTASAPAIEAISPPSSPCPSPADTPTSSSQSRSSVTPTSNARDASSVSTQENGVTSVPNSKKRALDFSTGPTVDNDVTELDGGNKKIRRPNTLPLSSVASSESGSTPVLAPSMSRDKQRCMSSLMSPETPRPRRSYGQLYLNGHAYTYLGLRSKTQVVYCCVFNAQPTYVPLAASEEPNLSMYSNWQVRKSSEPDGLSLTPPQSMALYDSNRNKNVRKDGAAFVVAAASAGTAITSTSPSSPSVSTVSSAAHSSAENSRPSLVVGFDSLAGSGYSPATYTVAKEREVPRTSEMAAPSSSVSLKTEATAVGPTLTDPPTSVAHVRHAAVTVFTPSSYWTEKLKNEKKVKVEKEESDAVRVKEETVDEKSDIAASTMDMSTGAVKVEPVSPSEASADKKQEIRIDGEHANKRKNKTPRKLSIEDGFGEAKVFPTGGATSEEGINSKSNCQPGIEDGTTSSVATSGPAPKRIKIFEGGFKSLDDYEYVRGRGRGRYVCGECGIRCKKPSMLKKHLRIHTNLRPYACKYCNFSFKTKGNLTKHAKSKAHLKKKEQVLAARNNNNDNGNGAENLNAAGKPMVASSSSGATVSGAPGDGSKLKDRFSSAEDDSGDDDEPGEDDLDDDEDLDDEEEGAEDDEDEDDDTEDDGSEGDETDEDLEEDVQRKFPKLPSSFHSVDVSPAKRDAVQGLLCLSSTRVAPTCVPPASPGAEVAPKDGVLSSLASVVTTLSARKEHEWLSVNSSQFLARMASPATDALRKPSDAALISPKLAGVVASTLVSNVVWSASSNLVTAATSANLTTAAGVHQPITPTSPSIAAVPVSSPSPPRQQTPPETAMAAKPSPPLVPPSNASGAISTDEETEEDEEPVFETDEDKDGGLPIHQGIITVPTGMFPPPSSPITSNSHAFFHGGQGASKFGATPSGSAVPTFGRVNGDDERSVCGICGKAFSKPSQLKIHVNIHYFERPHRCDACAVSFRTRGHLQKHKKSVSHFNKLNMNLAFGAPTVDNPRPFKCNDCDKPFRIHGHLAKHLRSKLHIMKLECLGKLPFGTYAEMERAGMSLNDIDTSDCENSLDSLIKVAAKLNLSSTTSIPAMPSVPGPPTAAPANSSPPRPSPQFQNHNPAHAFDSAFKVQDPSRARTLGGPTAPPVPSVRSAMAPKSNNPVSTAPSPVDCRQLVAVKYEDISDSD